MRTLFYYPMCPFSRTVSFIMAEKKLDFSIKIIKFWEHSDEFLLMSPFKKMPVLDELNGNKFAGIYPIIEYLNEEYSSIKLLSDDIIEKFDARKILHWFNEDFFSEITAPIVFEKDLKRYFKMSGKNSSPNSSLIKEIRENLKTYFSPIENFIYERKWLAGDSFSIADIVVSSHISIVDYFGLINWSEFEILHEWYMRIKSRPSFRRFLTEKIPGIVPPQYYSKLDF